MILFQHLKAFSTLGNLNFLLIQLLLVSSFLPNAISEIFQVNSFYLNFPFKVTIALLATSIVIKNKDLCKLKPLTFLYCLFFALYLCRVTLQFLYGAPELSKPLYTYWMWVVGLIILPTLALSIPTEFDKSIRWLRLILPASLLVSLATAYIFSTNHMLDPFGTPIRMGVYQVSKVFNKTQIGLVIALCFCLFFPRENKNMATWLIFFAVGLSALTSNFLVSSRAGLIACTLIFLLDCWFASGNQLRLGYNPYKRQNGLYFSSFGVYNRFICLDILLLLGYLDSRLTKHVSILSSIFRGVLDLLAGAVFELPSYNYAPPFLEAAICLAP